MPTLLHVLLRAVQLLGASLAIWFVNGPILNSLAWWLFGRNPNEQLARMRPSSSRSASGKLLRTRLRWLFFASIWGPVLEELWWRSWTCFIPAGTSLTDPTVVMATLITVVCFVELHDGKFSTYSLDTCLRVQIGFIALCLTYTALRYGLIIAMILHGLANLWATASIWIVTAWLRNAQQARPEEELFLVESSPLPMADALPTIDPYSTPDALREDFGDFNA